MINEVQAVSDILKIYNTALREIVQLVDESAKKEEFNVNSHTVLAIVNKCMEDVNIRTTEFLIKLIEPIDVRD